MDEIVFPEVAIRPRGLDPLVAAFGSEGEHLEDFVRQTAVSGMATSFVVLLGRDVSIGDDVLDYVPDYAGENSARTGELARQLQIVVEASVRITGRTL